MKKTLFAAILTIIVFSAGLCLAEVVVNSVSASKAKQDRGRVWVHLSADITNRGPSSGVAVVLEGVDQEGSTVKVKDLKGTIPPESTGTLWGYVVVNQEEYKKIVKWK
jgi:hypothetical protein